MQRVLLIHDKSTKYDKLTASDHRNSNEYGVNRFLFLLAYFMLNYFKNIPGKYPKMHRVVLVCDKIMRFDIFTAKDHRNKAGFEVN